MKITNLDKFMQMIGREPMLSKEEERKHLKAVKEKGADCEELEKLENANLRFVVSLARQYMNRGLDIRELILVVSQKTDNQIQRSTINRNLLCQLHVKEITQLLRLYCKVIRWQGFLNAGYSFIHLSNCAACAACIIHFLKFNFFFIPYSYLFG